jgi:spore maturation protein CgeB
MFDAAALAPVRDAFGRLRVDPSHHVYFQGRLNLLLGEAVVSSAAAWRPDLILAVAQAPLTEPALTALRTIGIRTAFWFVENVRVLPYWRDVVQHYDDVYGIQPDRVLDELRSAGAREPRYLPMACAPDVHRRIEIDAETRAKYGSAVSFAGAPYLNRRHILAAVADLGLRVWGDGWQQTVLAPYAADTTRFDIETMVRIFNATAVNLNVHSADHVAGLDPMPDYVNPRTFELAACGAFQLVDARHPLPALFDESEIITFTNAAQMRSLAIHYLSKPEERSIIAARSRARAVSAHTYEHRVAAICGDTLPPYLQPLAGHAAESSLDHAIAGAARSPALTREEALLRMVADVRDTVASR